MSDEGGQVRSTWRQWRQRIGWRDAVLVWNRDERGVAMERTVSERVSEQLCRSGK